MPSIKTAYHLINFGVCPDRSEDQNIRDIRNIGYEGVESIKIDYDADPSLVRDKLEKARLALAALSVPMFLMGTDDQQLAGIAKKQIAMARALGCSVTVGFASRTDGKNIHVYGTADEHYQEAGRRLNLLGKMLAESGVSLCLHNHIDNMTESLEEMEILMHETNEEWVSICFDTAHAVCGHSDPVIYAQRFSKRIRHLHLKDTKNLLFGRPYFFKNVFLPLGEGVIDFPGVMDALPDYKGWVTVELDATFSQGDPLKEARISLDYLRKLLAAR